MPHGPGFMPTRRARPVDVPPNLRAYASWVSDAYSSTLYVRETGCCFDPRHFFPASTASGETTGSEAGSTGSTGSTAHRPYDGQRKSREEHECGPPASNCASIRSRASWSRHETDLWVSRRDSAT